MTTGAWGLLLCTWTVVIFFTVRFLLMVIRTPTGPNDE